MYSVYNLRNNYELGMHIEFLVNCHFHQFKNIVKIFIIR